MCTFGITPPTPGANGVRRRCPPVISTGVHHDETFLGRDRRGLAGRASGQRPGDIHVAHVLQANPPMNELPVSSRRHRPSRTGCAAPVSAAELVTGAGHRRSRPA